MRVHGDFEWPFAQAHFSEATLIGLWEGKVYGSTRSARPFGRNASKFTIRMVQGGGFAAVVGKGR